MFAVTNFAKTSKIAAIKNFLGEPSVERPLLISITDHFGLISVFQTTFYSPLRPCFPPK